MIAEVKRKVKRINLSALEAKSQRLVAQLKGYEVRFIGLSLEDM